MLLWLQSKRGCVIIKNKEQNTCVWSIFFVLLLFVASKSFCTEKSIFVVKDCVKKADEVPYTDGIYPPGKVTLITGALGCPDMNNRKRSSGGLCCGRF